MERLIRLSKSCLRGGENQAVADVLAREYLGMGSDVRRFEQELSEFFGRPALCVVNGTAALHLAVQACGVRAGDEVLVPSLTFIASFQAVTATGAVPIACDIDPHTLVIDWRDAERRLTPRTKAIMPVHYAGGVGDLDGIVAFASRHGLRVIEDAAHAFGTTYRDRRIGSFGDVACFSFDGIKTITSGEGGCVVTDNTEVRRAIEDSRLLGVERDSARRYAGERSWEFDVSSQGWRYHMSNIMAAIGIAQLSHYPSFAATRKTLARLYDDELKEDQRIRPLDNNYKEVTPHIYVVRISGLQNRPELRQRLLSQGIETGIHYQPNHWLTRYQSSVSTPLPVTDSTFPELLTLPLHPDLSVDDVAHVCSTLKRVLN